MRIGYPCINLSLECRSSHTFRLKSYSPERLRETVAKNLDCLLRILSYNAGKGLLFFRISSDLVPFASHPVCRTRWQEIFAGKFAGIGAFILREGMRVSMHPDQFTLINSPDLSVFKRSVRELGYHTDVLDLMRLPRWAKIQIHVGGVYGDRDKSMGRFVSRYRALDEKIRRRLVIENDDRNYTVVDCVRISEATGIPVVFDAFHHDLNNNGEGVREALSSVIGTWAKNDGPPIVDWSCQESGKRPGTHANSIRPDKFRRFLKETASLDFDLMLEIKDKEKSALKALAAAENSGTGIR